MNFSETISNKLSVLPLLLAVIGCSEGVYSALNDNSPEVPQVNGLRASSVRSVNADGAYGIGAVIEIAVEFPDTVDVDTSGGLPSLSMETGPSDAMATYNAGSGTNILIFRFIVAAGYFTNDLNLAAGQIFLNGASLSTQNRIVSTVLPLTGNTSLAGSSAVVIDTIGATPVVTFLKGTRTSGPFSAGTLVITVTYDIPVAGVPLISIDQPGSADISNAIMTVSGPNAFSYIYTIIPDNGSDAIDGLATISLSSVDDLLGNPSLVAVNPSFTTDTTAPVVQQVRGTSGFYRAGSVVPLSVRFSENVVLAGGFPSLDLQDPAGSAICNTTDGPDLQCSYTVLAGDNSPDLAYAAVNALSAGSGVTLSDAAGNTALLTLAVPGSPRSLSETSDIVLDNSAPVFNIVSITSDNLHSNAARAGNTVSVNFTLNEPAGITPIALISGQNATISGSGPYFASYTMTAADTEGIVAFLLSAQDQAGNIATASVTTDASSVLFDRTPPVITARSLSGDNSILNLDFSEGIYNASGTSLTAGLFGINLVANGGGTSSVSVLSATHTAGSSSLMLSLSITGIPTGVEEITAAPVSASVFDYAGNAATTTVSAPALLNAANIANIIAGSIGASNAFADVTFDEGVFTSDSVNPVNSSAFIVNFLANGGSATGVTLTGATKTNGMALTGGESIIRLMLNVAGTPSGTETIEIQPAANSIYSAAGCGATGCPTPASNTTGALLLRDRLSPSVTTVTSGIADGSYSSGDVISVRLLFSEVVTITGNPRITLETGSTDAVAVFTGLTGGNTATFTFTVQAGMVSSDLELASALLDLNGAVITDISGNNANLNLPTGGPASLSAGKNIVIDAASPVITAAHTMDTDQNGRIDHYRLTFSRPVDDSTFPGYAGPGNAGTSATGWQIFNYTNAAIDASVPGDTPDDNTIYIVFAESGSADTSVKPDITASAPGLLDLAGNVMAPLQTMDLIETDMAPPVLISRDGSAGTNRIFLVFSEPVYGNNSVSDCGSGGEVSTAAFLYGNLSPGGAAGISGFEDDCGTDQRITILASGILTAADSADTIRPQSGIYDAAGNNALSLTGNLRIVTTPGILLAYAVRYNQIRIEFDAVMNASGTGSGECTGGGACFALYRIPGVTITSAVAADSAWNLTPGTNSSRFVLTTSAQQENSLYTLTVVNDMVARTSDSVYLGLVNNAASFYGDGVPFISSTSDSNCTDVFIQFDQDMNTTGSPVSLRANEPANYRIMSCSGSGCSAPYDNSAPVSASSASFNTATRIATISFASSMNPLGAYTIRVDNATDTNGNVVADPTQTMVNGCNAPDTVKPRLDNASAPSSTTVLLTFSEAVSVATAENPANYTIVGLVVSTAYRLANPQQVLLTTSVQSGASYAVVAKNITDTATPANAILENGVDNIQPFVGGGSAGIPRNLNAGHIFEDPFSDGTSAGQIFVYNGRLNVGPSTTHGSIFEMSYDMGTSSTITLDADMATTGAQPFKGYTYNIAITGGGCTAGTPRTLDGIDFFYAACLGTSDSRLSGPDCSSAGGSETLFVGGFFNGQGGCYSDIWQTSATASVRTFSRIGGLSAGGQTFRSASMTLFRDHLYVSMGVSGTGAVRFSRLCMNPSGCTRAGGTIPETYQSVFDLQGQRLRRMGRAGSLMAGPNGGGSTSHMIAIDSMWEYDNDGAGSNPSQLYIANGAPYTQAGNGVPQTLPVTAPWNRSVTSDGGILRTNLAYSVANNPPLNCNTTANCDTYWQDITPDSMEKWSRYMSIALPRDNTTLPDNDWNSLTPSDKFFPALKAIPYMRTAPNGDLYMIRNACRSSTVVTVAANTKSGFIANDAQTCPVGNEVPQIWMLPAGSTASPSGASQWVLVAERPAGDGRSDMSGNTGAALCGSGVNNKCDAENRQITLLEFNGSMLYIGYDNLQHGLNIWRADVSGLTSGVSPLESSFSLVAPGFGIGDPQNTRIFNHVSIKDGSTDYLVLVTRNGSSAVKIYRTDNQ